MKQFPRPMLEELDAHQQKLRKPHDNLLLEAHSCLVGAGNLFRTYAERCKATGGKINAADAESFRASMHAMRSLTDAIEAIQEAVK